MRLVDVLHRPPLQALRKTIVLFPRDIVVCGVEQFQGAVPAAKPVQPGVDRRVIVQILAVVNRSPLDLVDGRVDFTDRSLFPFTQGSVAGLFQVSSGGPQIAQSAQISRMSVLCETAQSAQR